MSPTGERFVDQENLGIDVDCYSQNASLTAMPLE